MILNSIGKLLRKIIAKKDEAGEYSSGFWPAKIRDKVLSLLPLKGKLLEIGCGEGLFLASVNKERPLIKLTGIDFWSEILDKAKIRLAGKDADLQVADGTKLPFKDDSFDIVICVNVLLNLPDFNKVESFLKEMNRVCSLNGLILFDIRNKRSPYFKLQFGLAKYIDKDLKVPLRTYNIEDIEKLVQIKKKHLIGFPKNRLVPVIVVEAGKRING